MKKRRANTNNSLKYANMVLVLLLAVVLTAASGRRFGDINEEVTGIWELSYRSFDTVELVKKNSFTKDAPGIAFQPEGKLIRRQNIGWCGTPPITYGNFDGTWEKVSDSVINISHQYWGGTVAMEWKLVKAEKRKLIFRTLETSRY